MRTVRCKCGKKVGYTSYSIRDCQGCEECQTVYSEYQGIYRDLQPHKWEIRYETHTGAPSHYACSACMAYKPLEEKVVVE